MGKIVAYDETGKDDNGMRFEDPYILLLLLLLPFWAYRYFRSSKPLSVSFPTAGMMKELPKPASVKFRHIPFFFRMLAVALIIVALARPQTGHGYTEITRSGIDIVMALDTSTSMEAQDLKPNRLEAAKEAMIRFVENRKNDRIGLVIFAGTSLTRCPLTLDYRVLKSFIEPVRTKMVEDGTAIGMAVAGGVNRLKNSDAKSKIIILLTDGVNNKGLIDPRSAMELAVSEGIKIYAIGVGRTGVFYQDVFDALLGRRRVPVRTEIDEELLKEMAERTGGQYFSAVNREELNGIYDEIDRLEKSDVKSRLYFEYEEQFHHFAVMAFALLLMEWLLSAKVMRRLPE